MGSVHSTGRRTLRSVGSVGQPSVGSCSSFGSVGSFLEYDRIVHHLSRGDLIEVQRSQYKHWVIFESVDHFGNVWCFHVTALAEHRHYDNTEQLIDDNNTITGLRKEISFNGKAILKYEPLKDILRDNDSPYESLCRVNNQPNMAQKMLYTTRNQLPNMDQVFENLHRMKDSLLQYCLKSLNCEHYCTLWKYGIGWSSQVNSFRDIVSAALKMMSTFSGLAAEVSRKNGCYRIGMVCLLISSIAAIGAKVVDGIDFTLNGLKIEGLVRQAIAN